MREEISNEVNDKKSLIVPILVIIILLGIGGWFASGKNKAGTKSESNEKTQSNQEESIKLSSAPSGAYIPKEIKVKKGTKVKIEGDLETLVGGMDTVIIDEYNIRKLIAPGDNLVEFVADKFGTFRIYCANGMGNGKLIVN